MLKMGALHVCVDAPFFCLKISLKNACKFVGDLKDSKGWCRIPIPITIYLVSGENYEQIGSNYFSVYFNSIYRLSKDMGS